MPSTDLDSAAFTSIDWDEETGGRGIPAPRTLGFLVALAAVAALFAYDFVVRPDHLVAPIHWDLRRIDWLVVASLVVVVRYTVVPLVADWDRNARYVRAFARRPAGVASLAFLVGFGLLGLFGVEAFHFTYAQLDQQLQPPVYTRVNVEGIYSYDCVGKLRDGYCYGTWRFPLGTNNVGENMIELLISGIHVAFKVGLAGAVIMAAVATAVGTTAGYVGGWVDDLLMRYVDIQQTIPAIVVYIVLATLLWGNIEGVSDGRLFTFIVVFGLLDWGGIARLIRSEAITRRSSGYVRAARAAGASDLRIVRRHVVPNSTATIVTALTRRIPLLVLAQVGLAYLDLNKTRPHGLGWLLRNGFPPTRDMAWYVKWWTTVPAVLFLVGLVVAFNVFGDTVRDVLDPREEVR
ncbi:MAG: ABC transporter permease [Halosimplex sp.]